MHRKHSRNTAVSAVLNNAGELTHQIYLQSLVVFWELHIGVSAYSDCLQSLYLLYLPDLLNMTPAKDHVTLGLISQNPFSPPDLAPVAQSTHFLKLL